MSNHTARDLSDATTPCSPLWIDAHRGDVDRATNRRLPEFPPEPIRRRLPVSTVTATMVQDAGCVGPIVWHALLICCKSHREFVPDTLACPLDWYAWCVARLGCDLTPAGFRESAAWQTFVATAQRLLEIA